MQSDDDCRGNKMYLCIPFFCTYTKNNLQSKLVQGESVKNECANMSQSRPQQATVLLAKGHTRLVLFSLSLLFINLCIIFFLLFFISTPPFSTFLPYILHILYLPPFRIDPSLPPAIHSVWRRIKTSLM